MPRTSPGRSAFAASIETKSVGPGHSSRRGLRSGVAKTASNGVQLLCESRVCQCRRMKGAGCTSIVGSGSTRRWWYRPCIQEGGPTHTPRTCSSRPQCLRKAAVSVMCAKGR
eukprot:6198994-Pleurochrysis_carterae.AAC.4